MAKIVEFNRWMTEYARRFFLSSNNSKHDVHFSALLNDTAVYLAKWSSDETLIDFDLDTDRYILDCPICDYYFIKHGKLLDEGKHAQAKLYSSMFNHATEFGTRLPTTPTFAVLAWYCLKTLLRVPLHDAVEKFDPLSVTIHLIYNACANKSLSLEQKHLRSLFTKMRRVENNGYKKSDPKEKKEDDDENDEEENENEKVPPSRKKQKRPKVHGTSLDAIIQDAVEYNMAHDCRRSVELLKVHRDTDRYIEQQKAEKKDVEIEELFSYMTIYLQENMRGCQLLKEVTSKNRIACTCLYSNTGEVTMQVGAKMNPIDSRLLISRDWYRTNQEHLVSTADFMADSNYAVGQVGIKTYDYTGTEKVYIDALRSKIKAVAENSERCNARIDLPDPNSHCVESTIVDEESFTASTDDFDDDHLVTMSNIVHAVKTDSEKVAGRIDPEGQYKNLEEKQEKIYSELKELAFNMIDYHYVCNNRLPNAQGGLFDVIKCVLRSCIWCDIGFFYEFRVTFADLSLQTAALAELTDLPTQGSLCGVASKVRTNPLDENVITEKKKTARNRNKKVTDALKSQAAIIGREKIVRASSKHNPKHLINIFTHGLQRYSQCFLDYIEGPLPGPDDVKLTYGFSDPHVKYNAFVNSREMATWTSRFPYMKDIFDRIAAYKVHHTHLGMPKTDIVKNLRIDLYTHMNEEMSPTCAMSRRSTALETDIYLTVTQRCMLGIYMNVFEVLMACGKRSSMLTTPFTRAIGVHNLGFKSIDPNSIANKRRTWEPIWNTPIPATLSSQNLISKTLLDPDRHELNIMKSPIKRTITNDIKSPIKRKITGETKPTGPPVKRRLTEETVRPTFKRKLTFTEDEAEEEDETDEDEEDDENDDDYADDEESVDEDEDEEEDDEDDEKKWVREEKGVKRRKKK